MANGRENLVPQSERTKEEQREIARQGGIASGKSRRERKTIADALRLVLAERASEGSEMSRQELIVAKVVKRLYDDGDIRDLKVLADILGESEQTLNIKGVAPIVAHDARDAAEIEELLQRIQERKDGAGR